MEKEIYTSRFNALFICIISGLVGLFAFFVLAETVEFYNAFFRLIFVALAVFCGFVFCAGLYHIFVKDTVCKITKSGITIKKAKNLFSWEYKEQFIPWKEIFCITIHESKFILLKIEFSDDVKSLFAPLVVYNFLPGLTIEGKMDLKKSLKKYVKVYIE